MKGETSHTAKSSATTVTVMPTYLSVAVWVFIHAYFTLLSIKKTEPSPISP
jgi:hypothetical protein